MPPWTRSPSLHETFYSIHILLGYFDTFSDIYIYVFVISLDAVGAVASGPAPGPERNER